jgi:hypothetical protein
LGCRDKETGHTPTNVTGGGENLCIGDLLSADGVGSLQEFHNDSELIPAEDRGGIIEGWIGAEIHVAWCGHHVANPEVHGISISWDVRGFHGMKNDRERLIPGRKFELIHTQIMLA